MTGPQIGREGSYWEGATNAEVLRAIVEAMGGPPVEGRLYRVGIFQGHLGRRVNFIADFRGMAVDEILDDAGRITVSEHALLFAVINPALPVGTTYGTREHPLVVWPFDIWHLSLAEPGDLDLPLQYAVEGEQVAPPPGRPRIH